MGAPTGREKLSEKSVPCERKVIPYIPCLSPASRGEENGKGKKNEKNTDTHKVTLLNLVFKRSSLSELCPTNTDPLSSYSLVG